ncbi:hypothetical protein Avbf_09526, partial [Armadillidium vulgare]
MTATLSADRRQKIVVDHSPMLKSLKPGLGSKMNMSPSVTNFVLESTFEFSVGEGGNRNRKISKY